MFYSDETWTELHAGYHFFQIENEDLEFYFSRKRYFD